MELPLRRTLVLLELYSTAVMQSCCIFMGPIVCDI